MKNNKIRMSHYKELTDYELTWFEMESQAKERKETVEASQEDIPLLNAESMRITRRVIVRQNRPSRAI